MQYVSVSTFLRNSFVLVLVRRFFHPFRDAIKFFPVLLPSRLMFQEKRVQGNPLITMFLCRGECPFAACLWFGSDKAKEDLHTLHSILCPLREEWVHHKYSALSSARWGEMLDKTFVGSPTLALTRGDNRGFMKRNERFLNGLAEESVRKLQHAKQRKLAEKELVAEDDSKKKDKGSRSKKKESSELGEGQGIVERSLHRRLDFIDQFIEYVLVDCF